METCATVLRTFEGNNLCVTVFLRLSRKQKNISFSPKTILLVNSLKYPKTDREHLVTEFETMN